VYDDAQNWEVDKLVRQIAMRILRLDMLALAALAFATTAAAPLAGHADETGAGGEVAVNSASPAIPPHATTADPWWGSAIDVTPKPWLRGTGDEPWRFTAAAYLWLPDAPLEVNLGPIDSSLPEDLGTILGSLQMALMLDFEARKGRFGGYVAPIFVWLRDDDNSVQGPIQEHQIIVKESVYLIDFGLSYEVGQWRLWNRPSWVLPSPAVAVEPFFGARSLIDDITFTLEPGGSHRPEISFIAPVIGLRTFWDITDRFNLRIEGDYGGFHVDGLEQTWNFLALAGYRFKPRKNLDINVFAGYRYLSIEYKKVAAINVDLKGPLLGVALEFH
jgi:hypothetical protein